MIRSVMSQYGIDHGTGLFPRDPTLSLFRYLIVRTTDQTNSVLENGSMESGYIICDPRKISTKAIEGRPQCQVQIMNWILLRFLAPVILQIFI